MRGHWKLVLLSALVLGAAPPAAESWRRDIRAELAAARLEKPELAARIQALEGVQPAKYLARRRPEPEVGRELAALKGADVFLIELAISGAANYPFAARAAYPARLSEVEVAALRVKEREAIEVGAVTALGKSAHRAAPLVLEEIAFDRQRVSGVRCAAAVALGETGAASARARLVVIAGDAREAIELRSAAIAGLAMIREAETIEVLAQLIDDSRVEVQRAAIAGVGSAASAWILARQQVPERELIARRAAEVLAAALVRSDALESRVIEAFGMIASPAVLSVLEGAGRDDDVAAAKRVARARERVALVLARGR